MKEPNITDRDIDSLYDTLNRDAEASGYHLNPDLGFTRELIKSLIINDSRYGYMACPCRLATGIKEEDLDIICPCDYRDHDLTDYDACYCALYVSETILKGSKQAGSIPERRPTREDRRGNPKEHAGNPIGISLPIWRCTVCGYLCARENPPESCPICKAKRERFKVFLAP